MSVFDRNCGQRDPHIRMEYNGIGFIPIHEGTAKQTA